MSLVANGKDHYHPYHVSMKDRYIVSKQKPNESYPWSCRYCAGDQMLTCTTPRTEVKAGMGGQELRRPCCDMYVSKKSHQTIGVCDTLQTLSEKHDHPALEVVEQGRQKTEELIRLQLERT